MEDTVKSRDALADEILPLHYENGPDYCTVTDAKGESFALTVRPDIVREMEAALRAAAQKQEPVAWLETFYEEGGGRETKAWLVEPRYDESTVGIVPLYANPPAPSEPQAAPTREEIATVLADKLWCGATFADALQYERDAFLSAADAVLALTKTAQREG